MTVALVPQPTDEQAMLLDASVRLMESEVPLAVVRARADGAARDDATYLRTAAELGWFGLLADEAAGGGSVSGNGLLDAVLVAAERGARLQPGPFAGHATVVGALSAAAPTPARDELRAGLLAGERWATWVGAAEVAATLVGDAGGFRLDGRAPVVADADRCGVLLVAAAGPDGPVPVLVRADAPGVDVQRLEGLDVTRTWAAVAFDGVAVAADDVLGRPGPAGGPDVAALDRWASVLVAAESVGAMHADLEAAVQYAKDRIAFGRPIGSFQAVKHLLADASLWLEMAKGLVVAAATSLGAGAPDGPQLAHAAKAFVAEHGIELAHGCFQVFGGIGYTWEHDQHLYLRRLAADAECAGSAAWHRHQLLDHAEVPR